MRTPPWRWKARNIPDWLVQGKHSVLSSLFPFFFLVNYHKLQTVYIVYQSSASVVRHVRDLILPSKSSNRDVCLVLSVYTFASFTCLKRSPERGSCCHASFGGHADFLVLVLSPMFGMTADFDFRSFDTPLYCCDT